MVVVVQFYTFDQVTVWSPRMFLKRMVNG